MAELDKVVFVVLLLKILLLLDLLEYDDRTTRRFLHLPLQLPVIIVGCDVDRHLLSKLFGLIVQLEVLHPKVTIK